MMRLSTSFLTWLFAATVAFAQIGPPYNGPIGPGGGGGSGSSGTVTSIATTCGTTGGTITTTGTISGTVAVRIATLATDTVLAPDCGNAVVYNRGTAIAVTLPVAGSAGFTAGYFTTLTNIGAGTATVTPTTSTIDGLASIALTQYQSMDIFTDGTNYFTMRGWNNILTAQDQTLSGGANVTANNIGTISSGTTTLDCGKSPLQYMTNNGAFTLAAPANDGSCVVNVTNGASAGTITFSGWTVGSNTGDTYATTNTNVYSLFVRRINGKASYQWSALQ